MRTKARLILLALPAGRKVGLSRSHGLGYGYAVFRQDAAFRGHVEKDSHGFNTFLIEDVVNIGCEVIADCVFGDGKLAGPLGRKRFDVLETVVAGLDEVLGDALIHWYAACNAPNGGYERQAGQGVPLLGQVVREHVFAPPPATVRAASPGRRSRAP